MNTAIFRWPATPSRDAICCRSRSASSVVVWHDVILCPGAPRRPRHRAQPAAGPRDRDTLLRRSVARRAGRRCPSAARHEEHDRSSPQRRDAMMRTACLVARPVRRSCSPAGPQAQLADCPDAAALRRRWTASVRGSRTGRSCAATPPTTRRSRRPPPASRAWCSSATRSPTPGTTRATAGSSRQAVRQPRHRRPDDAADGAADAARRHRAAAEGAGAPRRHQRPRGQHRADHAGADRGQHRDDRRARRPARDQGGALVGAAGERLSLPRAADAARTADRRSVRPTRSPRSIAGCRTTRASNGHVYLDYCPRGRRRRPAC